MSGFRFVDSVSSLNFHRPDFMLGASNSAFEVQRLVVAFTKKCNCASHMQFRIFVLLWCVYNEALSSILSAYYKMLSYANRGFKFMYYGAAGQT